MTVNEFLGNPGSISVLDPFFELTKTKNSKSKNLLLTMTNDFHFWKSTIIIGIPHHESLAVSNVNCNRQNIFWKYN